MIWSVLLKAGNRFENLAAAVCSVGFKSFKSESFGSVEDDGLLTETKMITPTL